MTHRVFNFSSGPSTLPLSVLETIQDDLISYKGTGMSVMEMSHRSKPYQAIIDQAEANVRSLMNVPEDYAVLFLQGGASLQFAMIPQNLYLKGKPVDFIQTGAWTQKALKELKKLGEHRIVASTEDQNFTSIPKVDPSQFSKDASYVYLCSNNTIFGTQWTSFPDTGTVPLVADMSSDIMSRPVDVSKFGVIFAGAQKNLGQSGVTLVIIRKDLIERAPESLPTMMQYRTHLKDGSMYNTPPTFAIYVLGLVLEWIKSQGGLDGIARQNTEKANLLYAAIDQSDLFYGPVEVKSRSQMNVVFRIKGDREDLEKQFVEQCKDHGLLELKGHRSVGGLRASIYNAQPLAAVQSLITQMHAFEEKVVIYAPAIDVSKAPLRG